MQRGHPGGGKKHYPRGAARQSLESPESGSRAENQLQAAHLQNSRGWAYYEKEKLRRFPATGRGWALTFNWRVKEAGGGFLSIVLRRLTLERWRWVTASLLISNTGATALSISQRTRRSAPAVMHSRS